MPCIVIKPFLLRLVSLGGFFKGSWSYCQMIITAIASCSKKKKNLKGQQGEIPVAGWFTLEQQFRK